MVNCNVIYVYVSSVVNSIFYLYVSSMVNIILYLYMYPLW